jgi:hypothetical protein
MKSIYGYSEIDEVAANIVAKYGHFALRSDQELIEFLAKLMPGATGTYISELAESIMELRDAELTKIRARSENNSLADNADW